MAGCSAPALAMSVPLLAFDTSTEALAAAVQADTGLFCWNGAGGSAASAQLIPRIRGLMTRAGLDFAQLRAIAFGSGPGAFTGLRTACAVAQGLAFGAALPVVALDSLLIVAEDARVRLPSAGAGAAAAPIDVAIDVVMDARMGEVYGASYRWAGGRWQVLSAPALYTLDALNATWTAAPPHCVAGSALQAFGARLRCGDAIRINDEADRAAATMRLAQQRWRDAGGVDAAAALPIYLRDKVALTVTERLALRDAEAAR